MQRLVQSGDNDDASIDKVAHAHERDEDGVGQQHQHLHQQKQEEEDAIVDSARKLLEVMQSGWHGYDNNPIVGKGAHEEDGVGRNQQQQEEEEHRIVVDAYGDGRNDDDLPETAKAVRAAMRAAESVLERQPSLSWQEEHPHEEEVQVGQQKQKEEEVAEEDDDEGNIVDIDKKPIMPQSAWRESDDDPMIRDEADEEDVFGQQQQEEEEEKEDDIAVNANGDDGDDADLPEEVKAVRAAMRAAENVLGRQSLSWQEADAGERIYSSLSWHAKQHLRSLGGISPSLDFDDAEEEGAEPLQIQTPHDLQLSGLSEERRNRYWDNDEAEEEGKDSNGRRNSSPDAVIVPVPKEGTEKDGADVLVIIKDGVEIQLSGQSDTRGAPGVRAVRTTAPATGRYLRQFHDLDRPCRSGEGAGCSALPIMAGIQPLITSISLPYSLESVLDRIDDVMNDPGSNRDGEEAVGLSKVGAEEKAGGRRRGSRRRSGSGGRGRHGAGTRQRFLRRRALMRCADAALDSENGDRERKYRIGFSPSTIMNDVQ